MVLKMPWINSYKEGDIMRNYNYDITTLFGNNRNNNFMSNFNFSDYASIKSGTYGKLLKSYYATVDTKTTKAQVKDKITAPKMVQNTDIEKVKKASDTLYKSLQSLKDKNMWEKAENNDKASLSANLKSFVKGYNDLRSKVKAGNSSNITKTAQYMENISSLMSKDLSEVGITMDEKGNMSFSEDTFSKADIGKVESLFKNQNSYGSQIESFASDISRETIRNNSLYDSNGNLNSMMNLFNNYV